VADVTQNAVASLLQQWVDMLSEARLPVLARTAAELELLQRDEDGVTPRRVADVVLHDPIMTVQVLQYLQENRNQHRSTDITTVAHALMMLGVAPFFAHFSTHDSIETLLAGDDAARHGVLGVISRARHAAQYAHDWAQWRHDIDPEEIMIAALLHDMAEILVWCYAPPLALEIEDRLQRDRTLRSADVQHAVLGFRLIDLQLALIKAWQLPDLLRALMDEQSAHNPRVRTVALATALARHAAHGWSDRALPDDYAAVADMLGFSPDEAAARVAHIALHAAAEWEWYGVQPPLPQLTSDEPSAADPA
jgi:HD-like signal output (HDOD) protein